MAMRGNYPELSRHTIPGVIPMLTFPIKPMLLQTADIPFDSPGHIFEWKVDGIRCIMFFDKGIVRLQSRTGKECTRQFPELWAPPVAAGEAIFDGEITVLTGGKPDFEAVMERYMAGSKKVSILMARKPAVYVVWDILWLNGKQVTGQPLLERKQLLEQALEDNDMMRKIEWVDGEGLALWEAVKVQGLEGMVVKKKNSGYLLGQRSPAWLKVKNYQEIEVNVFGYSKKDGAVLVGTRERVQGHAIGMKPAEREVLWELLTKYGTEKGNAIWLPPGVRGKVKFTTWTTRGNMRDCSWVGFVV